MNMFRNERGFTLIELMVVILIIGILVAIAVPVFNAARESAYKSTCQANLRTIDGAVETYKASTGNDYPTAANIEATLEPAYIKQWPACPSAGAYVIGAGGGAGSTVAPVVSCPGAPGNGHTYP
ncbi:MAG: type II secretion system protein [Actinomycetota bacterium]|nr:type II secretion system protein [Actinomycetota bacterium]